MFKKAPQYYTEAELLLLKSFEGKKLTQVFYSLWKNQAKEDEYFECLDWLELHFEGKPGLTFTAGEESDEIRVVEDFDFKMEKLKISSTFGNQINLERVDMSRSPHWLPALGKVLDWVGLIQNEQGHYLKEAIRFDFGKHKIDLTLGIEGLAVIVEEDE